MGKIVTKLKELITTHEDITSRPISQERLVPQKDLIVFSHLRWNFVFQRPQHIISRLAQDRQVIFVEEPIPYQKGEEGTAIITMASENITIVQPKISWKNLTRDMVDVLLPLTQDLKMNDPILWFYSPMFEPIAKELDHSLVVYDCMDELSAFKNAPQELIDKEKRLLRRADIVFTGGKSLYESKSRFHENVHCFPSSVDRDHFAQAYADATQVPADLMKIPYPRIGFYGVIDERLDLELLDEIARSAPRMQFVMIGPVVKISAHDLPKHPNIHYLGEKSYEELPKYLKGFHVALMPFALNKATRFISPTKTLEFMAARKPIVSTPIFDVKRDFQKQVTIVQNAHQCLQAINSYLHETPIEKNHRVALQEAVIHQTSWDTTVAAIKKLLNKALQSRYLEKTDFATDIELKPSLSLAV